MNRDERRLVVCFALLIAVLLAVIGAVFRGFVVRAFPADAKAQVALLDLFLRDRSRYLAETLQPERARGGWPENLPDILTRNHADFNRDIFMQVFETDGRLVAASVNTPERIGLSSSTRREGAGNLRWLSEEITDDAGRCFRLVTYPIYLGNPNDPEVKVLGFSQAGLRLPDAERAVARFTWWMAAGLAGFGGLLVVVLHSAVKVAAKRLYREGEALRAAQFRFVADAAHELGTPLAILRGEIDIALRRERNPLEYRVALSSCREEIERLSHLSENLLALATADAGQELIHLAPCDAAAIARAVHERFVRLATEKGVVFNVTGPDRLPWLADVFAIEQILDNLVANALRHTPAGDRVILSAAREAGEIVFQVQDTGEGIPPAHVPLLFNRFHRVDKTRSRSSGGAGLGLAIVKTLVSAHGGRVSVASEIGQGSIFTCRFPADSGVPSHAVTPHPPHSGNRWWPSGRGRGPAAGICHAGSTGAPGGNTNRTCPDDSSCHP